MEYITLARNDISVACERQESLVKTSDGWVFRRHETDDIRVSASLLDEMVDPDNHTVTIVIVSWDEMEDVWNNPKVHVVLIQDNDGAVILKFGPASPWGRLEISSQAIVAYDPTWKRWSMHNLFLGDVIKAFGF